MTEPLRRMPHPAVDENVRHAQALLRTAGYPLEADGRFGRFTELATQAFQAKAQLPPTGEIDDATLAKLVEVARRKAAPATTLGAMQVPQVAGATAVEPLPQEPYSTIGDSIVVGIDLHYRARGVFKRVDYHYRKDGQNPEMVGKSTTYIRSHLERELLPVADKLGIKTIVIGGGTNDFLKPIKSDEEAEQLYEDVTRRIAENIKLARNAGFRVISLGLPPEGQYIDTFRDADAAARTNELWRRINSFILSQAQGPDGPNEVIDVAALIGVTEDGVSSYKPEYRQGDPLHPKPEGSKVVAREIERRLVKLEGH